MKIKITILNIDKQSRRARRTLEYYSNHLLVVQRFVSSIGNIEKAM